VYVLIEVHSYTFSDVKIVSKPTGIGEIGEIAT
jgi:branched-subunit amino acid transport protein AzlD